MTQHAAFGINSSFRKRADSACFYEAWVGAVLARAGLCTTHMPFTVAKTEDEVSSYAGTWDLVVYEPGKIRMTQVEVKSTNRSFDTPGNYPHDPVLVCSKSSFLNKWPGSSVTGRDFLFVSRETGAILWLPKRSPVEPYWTYDKSRDHKYETMASKRSNLRDLMAFIDMVYGR